MSKYRRAAKIDAAQPAIVESLRKIPGITVAPSHDDILCGYRGKTYWYEIKSKSAIKKDGTPRSGALKPSQVDLLRDWTGHYMVVSSLDEILADLEISLHDQIWNTPKLGTAAPTNL